MVTSLRAFDCGLNEEHLEEISFLYEQRQMLRVSPSHRWQDMAAIEERLEAHLDALVVGGDLALEVCARAIVEGDFGQVFGAVCTFCRQVRAPLLAEALKVLDYADPKKVVAVADALKQESPPEWSTFIAHALARRDARLAPLLAAVAGHRRMHATAPSLADALVLQPSHAVDFLDALGRLHAVEARALLVRHMEHADHRVRRAALLALLRCGLSVAPASLGAAAAEPWACVPLAIGTDRSLRSALLQSLQTRDTPKDCLLALGLLGDPAALGPLTEFLDDERGAPAAAQALEWITGARLREQLFVPEEVDEALLFKHELAAWQQYKRAPRRLDGEPYGENVERVCQDKAAWESWLANHGHRFDASLRYRNGNPVSPATLLADLAAPDSSAALRRFAALELEIRYGCDAAYEVDMPVAAQMRALRQMDAWVRGRSDRFEPGRWYFQGELL